MRCSAHQARMFSVARKVARPFLFAEELNASLMNLLYFFFCLVVDGNGGQTSFGSYGCCCSGGCSRYLPKDIDLITRLKRVIDSHGAVRICARKHDCLHRAIGCGILLLAAATRIQLAVLFP